MRDISTSVTALQRLRRDFDDDYLRHPNVFYAVLHGEAFKRGGVAFQQRDGSYRCFEEYIKEHVAERTPCTESTGYKYPRFFFFGADAEEGARRLFIRCQIADRLLRDGLDLISYELPRRGVDSGKLPDHGYTIGEGLLADDWMYWMSVVGRATYHPLLKPRVEPPEVRQGEGIIRYIDGRRELVIVPTLRAGIGLQRYDEKGELPEWAHALETARDGSFESVEVFSTPVFYASTLLVDELLAMAGVEAEGEAPLAPLQEEVLRALLELKGVNGDDRKSTLDVARKAAGPAADPEAYKNPVAQLVAAGLVASKEGRGGGIWLTPAGVRRADRLPKL